MMTEEEIEQPEEYFEEPVHYPNTKQAIGLGLYFILFSVIAGIFTGVLKIKFDLHGQIATSFLTLLGYVIGIVATLWFGVSQYRKLEGSAFKFKFNKVPVIPVLVSVLIILTMPILTDPLDTLLPMPASVKKMFEDLFQPNLVAYFTAIIAAPILEEFLFRGIILNGLLKNYSPQKAIIISAALFAVIHMNPWQAVPAFLGGFLMGWMYWKTNSIIPGLILHCCNNLFGIVLGAIFTGTDSFRQIISAPAYIGLYIFCSLVMIGGWLFLDKYFNDNPTPEDIETGLEYLGEQPGEN